MDTQLEPEPERREGLGGRVRRFIDSELNRALDKKDRESAEGVTDKGDTDNHGAPSRAPESDRQAEPDRPTADPPSRPAQSVTTAPADTTYDSPVPASPAHDSPVHVADHDRGVAEAAASPVQGRTSAEAVADGSAERVGLLDDPAGLRDQWQRVQGTFVDDPQRAVHEASALVDRTLQEIHRNVTRGQTGDPTSTEDLRVSFQRYREFFQRLLSA
ncbi:MAG: hypothetical protein WBL53_19165 [Pseudonocardiaceae bacterium]